MTHTNLRATLLVVIALVAPSAARAICDVIPQPSVTYRAAAAGTDRPYASPGEPLRITQDATCDAGAAPFAIDDQVLLIVTPPGEPPVVKLVTDTGTICGFPGVAACQALLPPGATVNCDQVPFTANGNVLGLPVPVDAAGPAKIVVTAFGDPWPCELATQRCADSSGHKACIDELYESDSTCGLAPTQRNDTFTSFTALPPPNDFAALCTSADPSSPCDGTEPDLLFTVDDDGNALIPMAWSRVLVPGDLPIPRLVRGNTTFEAFDTDATPGTDPALEVPGASFVASYSTRGHRVPPLFTPLPDPNDAARLLGSVDAPRGLIRIARRGDRFAACQGGDRDGEACNLDEECTGGGACGAGTCQGGTNAGDQCLKDSQCPSSECGPALFDFSDRHATTGVAVPGAAYVAEAQNPVAIDALLETAGAVVSVRSELLEGDDGNADGLPDGVDLNGDLDVDDRSIVTVRLKATDAEAAIGVGGSVGSAIVRTKDHPFTVPSVAAEGDVVAFLEVEAENGQQSINADGDAFDYVLRVLRDNGTGLDEVTDGSHAVDPSLRVGQRALALSSGSVFFRERELDRAPHLLVDMQTTPDTVPHPLNGVWDSSSDGRHIAFKGSVGGQFGLHILDRDTDADGVFDEPGATYTEWISDLPGGGVPTWHGSFSRPRLSANGRMVVYRGRGLDMFGGGGSDYHIFAYDRDTDADGVFDEPGATKTVLASRLENGNEADLNTSQIVYGHASDDGRFLVYNSAYNRNPLYPLIWVHDRDADEDGVFDDEGNGSWDPGEIESYRFFYPLGGDANYPWISADGEWVAWYTWGRDLIPDDTNGSYDVYVAHRTDWANPIRTSVTSDGDELFETTYLTSLSPDGRFVFQFGSNSGLNVHDRDLDEDGVFDEPGEVSTTFLSNFGGTQRTSSGRFVPVIHSDGKSVERVDALTGVTAEVTELPDPGAGRYSQAWMREDGEGILVDGYLGFDEMYDYVTDSDPLSAGNAGNDLNADGDLEDTVLRVVDADSGGGLPIAATTLGPATEVAVAAGMAAFLVPEREVGSGTDLNGDSDTEDEVLHFWPGSGPVQNLGRAAGGVALSSQYIAAYDADTGAVIATPVASPGGAWTTLGVPLIPDQVPPVQVNETHLMYLADPAGGPVVYDLVGGSYALNGGGLEAGDFVLGEDLAAFRASENGVDLNADGDTADRVMHVFELATSQLTNTQLAAIPCPVEACDPTRPYRIEGGRLRFLTLEPDQYGSTVGCDPGDATICDLDGDGNGDDLVLQSYGVASAAAVAVAGTATGVCTDTAEACVDASQCGGGKCFVPPGGCLLDTGVACSTLAPSCGAGEICVPILGSPGNGTCFSDEGPCSSDDQCTAPAFCSDTGVDAQRIFSPVAGGTQDGGELLLAAGICLGASAGSCTSNVDCAAGELCVGETCYPAEASCRLDADCGDGFTCEPRAIVAGTGDVDGDGTGDAFDNCPAVANADQADLDQDGVGDACDRQTCGNGIQEYTETCDHGDHQNGIDGVCDVDCAYVGVGPACADGIDNDGDGVTDLADAGCADGLDTSERDPAKVCDDGRDNDGDYASDVGGDAGCGNPNSAREDPQCSDGIDNDGDGTVDWDGAGYAEPDNFCGGLPGKLRERPASKNCGVGSEIALLLPALWWIRRRGSTSSER